MPNRRTTIYLDDFDRQALGLLQNRYGLSSFSAVIRFTLRTLASQLQHGQVSQEVPPPDFPPNGSESLPHSPAPVTPALPLSSTTTPALASTTLHKAKR